MRQQMRLPSYSTLTAYENAPDKQKRLWYVSGKIILANPEGFRCAGLIAAVTYFLLLEHRDHESQFLPYMILLACPLMHLFMHGRHGHHQSEKKDHINH